jgi:hypothetical protein
VLFEIAFGSVGREKFQTLYGETNKQDGSNTMQRLFTKGDLILML